MKFPPFLCEIHKSFSVSSGRGLFRRMLVAGLESGPSLKQLVREHFHLLCLNILTAPFGNCVCSILKQYDEPPLIDP
jgi:hypothetical protein